jgi:hypothetical protein
MPEAEKTSRSITLSLAAAIDIASPPATPTRELPRLGKNNALSARAAASPARNSKSASLQDQATKLPVVTDILWFGGLPIYRKDRKDGAERNVGVAVQPLWPLGVGFRGKFH